MPRIRRRRHRAVTVTAPRPSEPRIAVLEEAGLRWIQIESPGAAEVAWLDAEFPFHELDLEDVRSRRQRPKVDDYDDYLFVVLHFPWYDAGTQRLYAAELNAFIGRDYLITLPNVPLKPISALFRRYEKDEEERAEHFAKGAGYVFYEVLDAMYAYCFPILDSIGRKLDDIEDALFDEGQSVVQEISNAKQEIISYRKIMKPQRPALRLLERDTTRFLAERPRDLLRRPGRRVRAHLGRARQLQGSRRGAGAHERVDHRPAPEPDPADPDRADRAVPAADVRDRPVRHEHRRAVGGPASTASGW